MKHKAKDSETIVADEGLVVLAVIKGSPAFKAGLKRGDVLLSLAGITLEQPQALAQVASKHKGKSVDIVYERNGQSMESQATLNSGH